jgi:hypothetical protein
MKMRWIAPLLLMSMMVAAMLALEAGQPDPGAPGRVPPPATATAAGPQPGSLSDPRTVRPPVRRRARPAVPAPTEPVAPEPLFGHSRDELTARGITPLKLFASRQAGRMTAAGIMARRLGDPALADEVEGFGRELWSMTGPASETPDDLPDIEDSLSTQEELLARLRALAARRPDQQAFATVVAELDEDLTDTMRGEPRAVDGKLDEEQHEPEVRRRDDDEEDATSRAGSTAQP